MNTMRNLTKNYNHAKSKRNCGTSKCIELPTDLSKKNKSINDIKDKLLERKNKMNKKQWRSTIYP